MNMVLCLDSGLDHIEHGFFQLLLRFFEIYPSSMSVFRSSVILLGFRSEGESRKCANCIFVREEKKEMFPGL